MYTDFLDDLYIHEPHGRPRFTQLRGGAVSPPLRSCVVVLRGSARRCSRLPRSVPQARATSNPVHDNEVAALGPEDPSVPPGPDHRPGQPCLVCHGGSGPASAQFAVGGTVYAAQIGTRAAERGHGLAHRCERARPRRP